ncbi:MAG: DNA gyrase inhibitor YacG [Alphaproteobacteria bacterium]
MTKCPLCKKPTVQDHRPFCSDRCKQIDLHRWIAGVYVIPTQETPEEPLPDSDQED